MNRIKLLPEIVANQIAAGEVVDNPASAIKEMMENSIDAGATSITVNFRNAGLELIQIVDNGCGMSPMDARMAFDRHATSKIETFDDLYRLQTFGFRGEALASIAAVSEVELRTRREGDELGTLTTISGGEAQRVKLATELSRRATGRTVYILDEPTSGLDPVVRDEVVEMFYDFTRDENHSVLISSHIVSDLEKLCDYVAFLHRGKLMLCEEKDELLAAYGLIHCTPEQLAGLDEKAVRYKKETPWGVEAMVLRRHMPDSFKISPISIEELFVFMLIDMVRYFSTHYLGSSVQGFARKYNLCQP